MRQVCVYLHVGALAAFRWWQEVSACASEKEGWPLPALMLLPGCGPLCREAARSGKPPIIVYLCKSKHCN